MRYARKIGLGAFCFFIIAVCLGVFEAGGIVRGFALAVGGIGFGVLRGFGGLFFRFWVWDELEAICWGYFSFMRNSRLVI